MGDWNTSSGNTKRDGNLLIKNDKWEQILHDMTKLNGLSVEIGLFGNEDDDPKKNVAKLGHIHEYGVIIKVTPKMRAYLHYAGLHIKQTTGYIVIPQRSFMRVTFDKHKNDLIQASVLAALAYLKHQINADQMLTTIGLFHQDQIKNTITTQEGFKKNHPFTIAKKGSSKALINTGANLLNRIDFKKKQLGWGKATNGEAKR